MRPTNCKNCGAVLHWKRNRCTCEYCGTEYLEEVDPITFECHVISTPAKWETLMNRRRIPLDALEMGNENEIMHYVQKEIALDLAEELVKRDLIEMRVEKDFATLEYVFDSRIRILRKERI